jgi:hypothetical protein
VPQLAFVNGNEILKSDRIRAKQNLPKLEEELERAAKENIMKKEVDPDKDNPDKYSKEYRRRIYKEMEEEREKKDEEKREKDKQNDEYWYGMKETKLPPVWKDNGEVYCCNQGKYNFKLEEDNIRSGVTSFTIDLPKHMDTSQVNVDLNPQYVRIQAKDKVTQIKFDYEIIVEKSTIQRSQTTGQLVIKCPIAGFKPRFPDNAGLYDNIPNEKEKQIPEKKYKYEKDASRIKVLKKQNENFVNNIEVVKHVVQPKQPLKTENLNLEGIDLSEIPDLD